MVAKTLTDEMVQSGADLVKQLDARGESPDAALWLYFSDLQEWKLVLAEMKMSSQGPRAVYEAIREALSSMPKELKPLSLELISVAKPDAPLIQLLSSAVQTGPGIGGIRFTNNVINGTVIEDAYIYRLATAKGGRNSAPRAKGADGS